MGVDQTPPVVQTQTSETRQNVSAHCSTSDVAVQIQQQLNALKKSTQDCGLEIEKTRQLQEHHSINFYKHHQLSGNSVEKAKDRVALN